MRKRSTKKNHTRRYRFHGGGDCTQALETCNNLVEKLQPLVEEVRQLHEQLKKNTEEIMPEDQQDTDQQDAETDQQDAETDQQDADQQEADKTKGGGWLEGFFAGGGRRKHRGRGKTRAIRRPMKRKSRRRK